MFSYYYEKRIFAKCVFFFNHEFWTFECMGWAGVGADQPFKVYMDYYQYYYIIINITVRTGR